jgi:hypothetical protein
MTSNLRPCLYCERPNPIRTKEHVLQSGFGANWTLTEDVCTDCNTPRFNPLDTALINFARTYVYRDHPDVMSKRTILQEGHADWFDEQHGIWIRLRVGQDGKPVFFPQFIFRKDTKPLFLTDRADDPVILFERIKSELRHPQLTIKDQLVDLQSEDFPEVQPALIRSNENAYYIRAVLQEDANRIRDMISSGVLFDAIPEQKKSRPISQLISVRIDIFMDYDRIERALAKSALNFLCAAVGPEVARYDCFSELRRFVLGEYPAALEKFVTYLCGRDRDRHRDNFCSQFFREGHHTLVLWEMEGFPLVFFLLYSRLFAIVRLLKEPHTPILGTEGTRIAFFDYKSKTHSLLTLGDYIPDFCDQISLTFGPSNIPDSAAARRIAENQAWDKLKTKLGGP